MQRNRSRPQPCVCTVARPAVNQLMPGIQTRHCRRSKHVHPIVNGCRYASASAAARRPCTTQLPTANGKATNPERLPRRHVPCPSLHSVCRGGLSIPHPYPLKPTPSHRPVAGVRLVLLPPGRPTRDAHTATAKGNALHDTVYLPHSFTYRPGRSAARAAYGRSK